MTRVSHTYTFFFSREGGGVLFSATSWVLLLVKLRGLSFSSVAIRNLESELANIFFVDEISRDKRALLPSAITKSVYDQLSSFPFHALQILLGKFVRPSCY